MLKRESYLSRIRGFYDSNLVKILVGIRRCGKSVILNQIVEEIKDKGVNEDHIIYVNFELVEFEELQDYKKLNKYIKDNIHLSELQDKYHKRLIDKGYDLERGIKGSDRKHIKIKDYKNINRKLEQNLNTRNERLDKAMNKLEEQMKYM